ncbi:carbohydrate deacetylase isoform X2 [Hydra vulgaris]|uniref:Carbohydrate deacetylase n=1 Tax=Hydra vulgaris TaxID=6087 RepID=A0ABM4CVP4_HYDVU
MIKIRITADDFGYCKRRNLGILETIDNGSVNSVSILMNGSDVIKLNKDVQKGLHVNLTEGDSTSEKSTVSTLLGPDQLFLGKFGFREKLCNGEISKSELRIEIESQIKAFINKYLHIPTHVDGHQHVHVLPLVRDLFAELLQKYSIKETRVPYEIGIIDCKWIEEPRLQFYKKVCEDALSAKNVFNDYGLSFSDYFIGLTTMSRDFTEDHFMIAIKKIKEDLIKNKKIHDNVSIEVMVHPGYASENNDGGCGGGPDSFSLSNDREFEVNALTSKWFKNFLSSEHMNLL